MPDDLPTSNFVSPASCLHEVGDQKRLFKAQDYISGDWFELVRCRECGLALTQPVPAAESWSRHYPSDYYGAANANRFPLPIEWLQTQFYGRRVRRMQKFIGGQPGRVLDVGCGRGFLLQEFRRQGWDVLGTEAEDKAAAHARQILQLPVRIGALDSLDLPSASFDVVVLWHVLEHLRDPAAMLAQVGQLLRPGGMLLVGVPNFGSMEAWVCRNKWFHLDVPRHLNHFTPDSLERALRRTGLQVCAQELFAPEYDVFSLMQSLLNRAGLRHNYLYNLLRGQQAKVIGQHEHHWAQLLGTVLLGLPLAAVSIPAVLLAGAFRHGSAITMYARKS